MNNNYDRHTNTQMEALKDIQANSVSVNSINQSIQNLFNIQFQKYDINSRRKLLKLLRGKVEHWKHTRLYDNEWLQPLLQERNELVSPFNTREQGILAKSNSQQFLEIGIKEFFKKERIQGRLLILGNPGSGKKAATMQIVEEMIISAENNHSEPIPFWFDLSSWNEQSLEKWLIIELNKVYGVSPRFGRKLLRDQLILPILDDLDRLKLRRQLKCITAINNFLKKDKFVPLIVCCRLEGYNTFYQLSLNGAVCLQPLSEEQVQDYCKSVKNFELSELFKHDSNLFSFAKTPLFLFLINDIYKSINLEEWRKLDSDKQRIYYLFDIFIIKYQNEASDDVKSRHQAQMIDKTKARLAWLAKKLKEHSSTYFLIENIQPSWLDNENQKMRYRLLVALMVVFFSFPMAIIISGFMLMAFGKAQESLIQAMRDVINIQPLVIALLTSVILGVTIDFLGLTKEIKPVETLKLPGHELIEVLKFAQLKERLITVISLSFTQKIPVTDNNRQFVVILQDWISNIVGWILKIFIGWLIPPITFLRGLLIGLTGPNIDLKKRAVPNQGIHNSLRNTVPFVLIFGLLGFIIGLGFKVYEACVNDSLKDLFQPTNISFSIFFALLGVLLGMIYTCLPVIQHFALRLVLFQDDLFPIKYAKFLDHTNEYRLTQRYGGRYYFIHDLLQDYFENLQLTEANIKESLNIR